MFKCISVQNFVPNTHHCLNINPRCLHRFKIQFMYQLTIIRNLRILTFLYSSVSLYYDTRISSRSGWTWESTVSEWTPCHSWSRTRSWGMRNPCLAPWGPHLPNSTTNTPRTSPLPLHCCDTGQKSSTTTLSKTTDRGDLDNMKHFVIVYYLYIVHYSNLAIVNVVMFFCGVFVCSYKLRFDNF